MPVERRAYKALQARRGMQEQLERKEQRGRLGQLERKVQQEQ